MREERRDDIIVPVILVIFDLVLVLAIIFAFVLKANDLSIMKMFGVESADATIDAANNLNDPEPILPINTKEVGLTGDIVAPNDDPGPGPDANNSGKPKKWDYEERPRDPSYYDDDPEPPIRPIMDWDDSDYDDDPRPPMPE